MSGPDQPGITYHELPRQRAIQYHVSWNLILDAIRGSTNVVIHKTGILHAIAGLTLRETAPEGIGVCLAPMRSYAVHWC